MKNIEDLKKRLWSRMRNYTDDKKLLRRYMNDLNLLQAEYDKSIKEMIEEWNIIYDNGTSFFEKKDGSFRTNSGEVFVKELLSQFNSQVDEDNNSRKSPVYAGNPDTSQLKEENKYKIPYFFKIHE